MAQPPRATTTIIQHSLYEGYFFSEAFSLSANNLILLALPGASLIPLSQRKTENPEQHIGSGLLECALAGGMFPR